jgi:AAA lid domain
LRRGTAWRSYITNRFLPDKAIDLIDESCAQVRVALDSQPEVIDRLERRQLQLEVEVRCGGSRDAVSGGMWRRCCAGNRHVEGEGCGVKGPLEGVRVLPQAA